MIEELYAYNEFAEVYDIFMGDVDYNLWCRYVEDIFNRYGIRPERILDTACGTGNITIPMSISGYEVWGLDISSEMLSIAEKKSREANQKIRFLNQNMIKMDLSGKYDAILCMCDGVNYILSKEDILSFFHEVYKCMEKEGIFIFDISSYNKIRYVLGNNTFHEEKYNNHYIWNNNFDEVLDTIEMDLIFFIPQKDLYKKFEEHHVQKAHKEEYLVELLADSGFKDIEIFDGFSFNKPNRNSERIFFKARK